METGLMTQLRHEYADTEERCHPEHMDAGDLQDHVERYRFAGRFVRGKRVLDVASGTGYGSEHLRKCGANIVVGVDVSETAVREAIRSYGPHYRVGSVIDFDDEPFDVIVSFETIEHVDDYRSALRNLRRLLAPGGVLILSTPNRPVNSPELRDLADKPRNIYHVREFSTAEIVAALTDAGFASIEPYGQRQRRRIRNRLLYSVYAAAAYLGVLPGHFSAAVLPLREGLEPRYCVLVCRS
jgi:2-polyprenyl-3-methyl-5-hydroxy-6-metoxy-1,4-benzoquinol methylase